MDLGAFDFRTGKMLMSKMNKSRQRVRYDSSNQVKVSHPALLHPITMEGEGEWGKWGGRDSPLQTHCGGGKRADSEMEFTSGAEVTIC